MNIDERMALLAQSGYRVICLGAAMAFVAVAAPAQNAATVPQFQVDPFWPKPLPNNWLLGQVSGIAVDKRDHIWVVHRPASLSERERARRAESAAGKMLRGRAAGARVRPVRQSRRALGRTGAGLSNGPRASTASSSTTTISFGSPATATRTASSSSSRWTASSCCRSARAGRRNDSNSTRADLGSPADIAVDVAAKEVYVADGYRNRRVVVFDSETGAYKRHWGAYGKPPSDEKTPPYDPARPPSQQFGNPCTACASTRTASSTSATASTTACRSSARTARSCPKTFFEKSDARHWLGLGARVLARPRADVHLHGRRREQRDAHRRARPKETLRRSAAPGGRSGQFTALHNIAVDGRATSTPPR